MYIVSSVKLQVLKLVFLVFAKPLTNQNTMSTFSKELLDSANEIICDKSLNDYQKYNEIEEMLLDEGYDADDMVDFLLALS